MVGDTGDPHCINGVARRPLCGVAEHACASAGRRMRPVQTHVHNFIQLKAVCLRVDITRTYKELMFTLISFLP